MVNFCHFWTKFGPNQTKKGIFGGQKFKYFHKIFCNIFEVLEDSSELSENIKKIMLNLKFENCKKLVSTQKPTQKFKFKFGMQGLIQFENKKWCSRQILSNLVICVKPMKLRKRFRWLGCQKMQKNMLGNCLNGLKDFFA